MVNKRAQFGRHHGLVVIGVHAPEFAFEKNIDNVKKAISGLGTTYPVAIGNDYAIWRAFDDQYWPAHYFSDTNGKVRHHHFGEGDYDGSERVVQQLLAEAGKSNVANDVVDVKATGVQAASDEVDVQSSEPGSARTISSRKRVRSMIRPIPTPPRRHVSTNGG